MGKRLVTRRLHGFTLIELMVTLALVAVLMTIGVPSIMQYIRNSLLAAAVNDFVAATQVTKSTALQNGRNAFLVPEDADAGWASGWFVYSDSNWNDTYDAGTDTVVIRREALDDDITVTLPSADTLQAGYLMYSPSGFPRLTSGGFATGRMELAVTGRTSTIIMSTGGRVRVTTCNDC